MTKFAMQIETAHPVLFLGDAESDVAPPEDVSVAFVTTTPKGVAFWILSYVDGVSLVTLSDNRCPSDGIKLFSGSFDAPSGVITLMDSSGFKYLNVPVTKGRVTVDLWANDNRHPDWVWIQLGQIRLI